MQHTVASVYVLSSWRASRHNRTIAEAHHFVDLYRESNRGELGDGRSNESRGQARFVGPDPTEDTRGQRVPIAIPEGECLGHKLRRQRRLICMNRRTFWNKQRRVWQRRNLALLRQTTISRSYRALHLNIAASCHCFVLLYNFFSFLFYFIILYCKGPRAWVNLYSLFEVNRERLQTLCTSNTCTKLLLSQFDELRTHIIREPKEITKDITFSKTCYGLREWNELYIHLWIYNQRLHIELFLSWFKG